MNWLFLTLLFSTLLSQSVMDAASGLIALTMLWTHFRHKKSASAAAPLLGLEKFWLIWLLIVFIGLISSTPESVLKILEWKWIINLYTIYWLLQKHPFSPSQFKIALRGLMFFSITALIGWALKINIANGGPTSEPGRVGGFYDDPMTFAHMMGMYFCLLAGFGFYQISQLSKNKKIILHENIELILGLCLVGTAAFLTMTRGVWIGVFISLIAMTTTVRKRWGLYSLLSIATIGIILFYIWPVFHERLLQSFSSSRSYDGERIALWRANWLMFLDHPWFGVGYGEYRSLLRHYFDILGYPANQFESHAHNQYLHFLANTGILGLSCYLYLAIYFLRKSYLHLKKAIDPIILGSFGAQICFLIGGLTESNFERSRVRLVYLIMLALFWTQSTRAEAPTISQDTQD